MMQLSERVYLVGSGQHGMRLTNSLDCHVYLLDGGSECALIDAGCGLEPERIVANIEKAGFAMSQVRHLLLTHAHADHTAGANFWKSKFGLNVVCAHEAAPWIMTGDEEASSLRQAKLAGAYPMDFIYPPCPINQTVGEGDILQVGEIQLQVLETPGHARGHVSYAMQEDGQLALFTGDVVFSGGTIVLQNTWDCSIQEYAATTARLHKMHVERLYPGHKSILISNAYLDIQRAHECFENLGVPPNFN